MSTSRPRPGLGDCPDCAERVLFALMATGELLALSTGPDGPWVVRWDITDTPRCRRVPDDYQCRSGEHRFRPHAWSCKALARVRLIGSAPSARPRRPSRPVTPATPRRANAR
jgi:hypothetical protein